MNKSQPYYIKNTNTNMSQQKRINTMIYYLFPRFSIFVAPQSFSTIPKYQYQNPNQNQKPSPPKNKSIVEETNRLSFSLSKYMEEVVHSVSCMDNWNVQVSNPYNKVAQISKIKHVSFIFYELIEVYHIMNLCWDKYTKLSSLHLGKDANTTIKMCQYIRKQDQAHDENYSVYSENYSVNLLDYYYREKRNTMDVIIMDASSEFEYQNAIELIMQLCIGLCAQKHKGTCIIKYGETFSWLSLDILALISHFYEKTFFLKPSICDLASGEKYLVCKNFTYHGLSTKMYETLRMLYLSIEHTKVRIERLLHISIPLFISSKLEEINSIFGQSRLEHIQHLLTHSENWYSEKTVQDQYQKGKEWCLKHNIPFIMPSPLQSHQLQQPPSNSAPVVIV
jgi:hypothetical protein